MTVGRRGLDMLLLAVAGILCCLLLLSTTSSGAQATAVAQSNGATAVAGGDNCVDSQSGDNTTTDQQTGTDNNSNTTTDNNSSNPTTDNTSNTTSDNNNTSDNTTNNNSDTTSSDNTSNTTTDNNTDNTTTDNNSDTTSDDQEDVDNTQSSDTGNNTNDECVVANTVPDKSLPFTGAPVKPQGSETSAKKDAKSDNSKKQTNSNNSKKQTNSNDSKNQTKSDNGKKQTNSNHSGTQKKSKRVETLNYRGKKLQIEDRSKEPRQKKSGTSSKSTTAQEQAPNWPVPSREEAASADQIRRFAPNPNSQMTLSVRALGIYDASITDFDSPDKLDNGLVRVPETSRPWDPGDKNMYVAGHYLGYDRTPSRLIFYNLHNLKKGDKLAVKDSLGRIYNYQVSEKFAVSPNDKWVMGQVRGRDMLTLQTCVPPDFGQRLVVRADRVKNT